MNKTYVGIDNGVTGSIFILQENNNTFFKTPVKLEQSYTKTKQNISRLECIEFYKILDSIIDKDNSYKNTIVIIERPMVNFSRFKATLSAIRCLEATLICLESRNIPYMYIDSKQWQKELLPSGIVKGELKKTSIDIGVRLFPQFKSEIIKQKDADAILIAEFAKRKGL